MQGYDEFFSPDGGPRPHQAALARFLSEHTPQQAESLRHELLHRLHEQEVSYNILGAPDGSMRGWALDEVPHVIVGLEFQQLAEGISDRAELLSECLDDFYGPRRLIREGIVPAEVLLGNPHFFRALHGTTPVGGSRLTLYAADVVKTNDGRYVVHSDRTAAPTGAGYALENRLAIGQILSQPFVEYRVQKVNRFFENFRQTLTSLSPRSSGVPRIVLLTPGVQDESSFEHGYLARYLGFQLVEGRDLTVRGEQVFLKTLEGLKPVDVIVRRLMDDWCDPLELRGDSTLGVPGLVGAARANTVAIANPLGSGVAESPALRAYLPQISQALRGRPLLLPSIPTMHLGDPLQREEVLDTFDSWILRPAFDDRRSALEPLSGLSSERREQLRAEVLAAPAQFVAELWPAASLVPRGLSLEERGTLSIRAFACRSGDSFVVMPGGLGRVDDTPDGMFLQAGAGTTSKDVWVVGERGAQEPALPQMPQVPLTIQRGGVDVPSRLLDDIYWLGRYTQRAEGAARLVRAGLSPLQAEARDAPPELQSALLVCLAELHVLSPRAVRPNDVGRAFLSAVFDETRGESIRSCLTRIYSLTTGTRSRLSVSMWDILRRAHEVIPPAQSGVSAGTAVEQLDELLVTLAAFHGITGTSMVRGPAWYFLELGRRLEHAAFVLTLLNHLFQVGGLRERKETLLSVCDSLMTYRSRYLSSLQPVPVVDLVLTDETNPQSVVFQVQRLLSCVRDLPHAVPFPLSRAEQRLVTLQARLLTADLFRACRGEGGDLRDLAEEGIQLLWQVSDDLTQHYFIHASRSRSVAPSHWIDAHLEADS